MNRSWAAGLPVLLCLATTAPAAHAAMFTDLETIGGHDLAATADFKMTDGKLALTLNNVTSQTVDAAQLLTGITFTLANGTTVISSAGFTASGAERTVLDDGSYTDSPTTNLPWELLPGAAMQIDFNPAAHDALIGPASGETASTPGVYSANASITGNAGNNPFGAEIATFTFTSPEILSTTDVTNVTFLWGTSLTPSLALTGDAAVPEPASISLLGCGALLLLRRRRHG